MNFGLPASLSTRGAAGFLTRCVLLLFVCLLPATPLLAQQDSTEAVQPEVPQWLKGHSPRGALWRAAVLPGWGQVYNRQYLKLPFVYAGLAGITATALVLNDRYLFYRHAFLYKRSEEMVASGQWTENPFLRYKGAYDEVVARYGEVSSEPLRTQRDKLRRNRDLSYFGIGLFYGLTVLDAYVNAHLLDFAIG